MLLDRSVLISRYINLFPLRVSKKLRRGKRKVHSICVTACGGAFFVCNNNAILRNIQSKVYCDFGFGLIEHVALLVNT